MSKELAAVGFGLLAAFDGDSYAMSSLWVQSAVFCALLLEALPATARMSGGVTDAAAVALGATLLRLSAAPTLLPLVTIWLTCKRAAMALDPRPRRAAD